MKAQIINFEPVYLIIGWLAVFVFSIIITGLRRRYALKHALMDEPNSRSSHSIPTPTAGGLSISLCFLAGIGLLAGCGFIPVNITVALAGGGLIVSVVGWIDDHGNTPVLWRAVFYLVAAMWGVFWIGGLGSIELGMYTLPLPRIGSLSAVLGIAWLTNLYNFMDGTDGIAGTQAISTALLAGILFWMSGQEGLALLCFILMAASTGFLVWNWPPAKIFMGDVGSCLIGFSFGILALTGEKTGALPILLWIIMLAVFICDATFTLFRRIVTGERWYGAHRSHAYQRFIQLGASHEKLALSVLFINTVILWPLASIAYVQKTLSIYMALLAIIIMAALWVGIQLRYAGLKHSGA